MKQIAVIFAFLSFLVSTTVLLGQDMKPADETNPRFSPDNQWLSYWGAFPPEGDDFPAPDLILEKLDGTQRIRVTVGANRSNTYYAWSPASDALAMEIDLNPDDLESAVVTVYDIAAQTMQTVYDHAGGCGGPGPRWSPAPGTRGAMSGFVETGTERQD